MCKRFSHVIALVLVLSLAGGAWADLVGHWKLDEGGGTTAQDSSGNGNNGTLQGAPVWVAGVLGRALQFNGSNSVNCGDASKLASPRGSVSRAGSTRAISRETMPSPAVPPPM